jgi:hypothetical protein
VRVGIDQLLDVSCPLEAALHIRHDINAATSKAKGHSMINALVKLK